MPDVSSHGRTQLSGKSINLEANILSEWSGASAALQQRIKVQAIALCAVLCMTFLVLPQMYNASAQAAARALTARNRNAVASRAAAEASLRSKAEEPAVQESQMLENERTSARTLLGNLALIFNSVPTHVAFDSVHAEIMDAELTITCKSQAESFDDGQTFVSAASKGPNVLYAVQASTMKSSVLADDGVAFDFIKRVNLEP